MAERMVFPPDPVVSAIIAAFGLENHEVIGFELHMRMDACVTVQIERYAHRDELEALADLGPVLETYILRKRTEEP